MDTSIVLTGSPAFADEKWSCLRVNGVKFRNVRPCSRCNLPTVDQATGVPNPQREPQKTLTRLRNGALLGFVGGKKHESYFGSNLIAEGDGKLTVGDDVHVLTLKTQVFA